MSVNPLGFVIPAATIGLGALLIKPQRGFYDLVNDDGEALAPIVAAAVIEEIHHDELVITEHPIEQGASIADHAYKLPAEVLVRMIWSDSPSFPSGLVGQAVGAAAALGGRGLGTAIGVAASLPSTIRAAQSVLSGNSPQKMREIYQQLLEIQATRIPFTVYTGKRTYKNMLLRSLSTDTNKDWENAMMIVARCHQVIIVSTQVVSVPASAQKSPQVTGAVQQLGTKSLVINPTFTRPAWLGG